MSWQDRIQEAAFTTPDGSARITFSYENVGRTVDKKTTAFNFPDADGVFIQDRGHSGRRYPVRAIFHGDDCDLEASVFEAALLQRGVGKLEHPIYGTVDAVAFGQISRRDDLVTAANQAIVDVVFWETTGTSYPSEQSDAASDIAASLQAYNENKAENFKESGVLDNAVNRATFKNAYIRGLNRVRSILGPVAEATAEVKDAFDAIADSIELSIDVLIGQPIVLASQTSILLQTPARSAASIQSKFDGYAQLLDVVIESKASVETQVVTFESLDLFAAGAITGLVVSANLTQFETKSNAIEAAEGLIFEFDRYINWRDVEDPNIDTGESYGPLLNSVSITAGFLIDLSFTLRKERQIIMDRARTIVDLSAELYSDISDDALNVLINTNSLTGSEILEIPRGRKIVYYI